MKLNRMWPTEFYIKFNQEDLHKYIFTTNEYNVDLATLMVSLGYITL
jgi:hypothetical protein